MSLALRFLPQPHPTFVESFFKPSQLSTILKYIVCSIRLSYIIDKLLWQVIHLKSFFSIFHAQRIQLQN